MTIYGLIASTGPGHQAPQANCTPPERPGKPGNSTACVEIWSGTTILIDGTGSAAAPLERKENRGRQTLTLPERSLLTAAIHHGEVSADVGMSGGTSGRGWIDVLAHGDIALAGNTTTPYTGGGADKNNLTIPPWILHADMALQNGFGGDIAVQSTGGNISTSGRAIQANASTSSNGGKGGHVKVEASGNMSLGTASVQAMGDNSGGGGQQGGTIVGHAFSGTLTGGPPPGELNADGGGGGGSAGSVSLFGCLGVTYTGTSTPAFAIDPAPICGNPVVLPSPADTNMPAAGCTNSCGLQLPTPTEPDEHANEHADEHADDHYNEYPDEHSDEYTNEYSNDRHAHGHSDKYPDEYPTNTPTTHRRTHRRTLRRTLRRIRQRTRRRTPRRLLRFQGCTPGYWKHDQHFDSWPAPYVPTGPGATLLKDIFNLNGFTNLDGDATADDTLLEGLNYKGGRDLAGAAQILLRAASAAVLNAASFNYPLSLAQIKTVVNNALASGDRDTTPI